MYQKLAQIFTGKNLSNINALIHGINIRSSSKCFEIEDDQI